MQPLNLFNVQCYLHNKATIDPKNYLEEALELMKMPRSNMLLLFSDKEIINRHVNGKEIKYLGLTYCQYFDKFFNGIFREIFDGIKYIELDDNYGLINYDCWIAISKKVCDLIEKYPAYFVFIMGHELAHAKMILENKEMCIINYFVELNILKVSNSQINQYRQLPHECFCDNSGIDISEKIFGIEKLVNDLTKVYMNILNNNKQHELSAILNHEGPTNYSEMMIQLRKLIDPYRAILRPEWEQLLKKDDEIASSNVIKEFGEFLSSN